MLDSGCDKGFPAAFATVAGEDRIQLRELSHFAITLEGQHRLLLGAPAAQLDLQAYLRFLAEASVDPKLTPDAVFDRAEAAGGPIGWAEKLLFRYYVFPRLASHGARLPEELLLMAKRPDMMREVWWEQLPQTPYAGETTLDMLEAA